MSLYDFLRLHNEIKDKIMPEPVQALLELKEKLKPLEMAIEINSQFQNETIKTALGNYPKEFGAFKIDSFSLHDALDFYHEKNFAAIYNYHTALDLINNSILGGINTSTLGNGFELYKLLYRNFTLPDFEELKEDEEQEENQSANKIIQIGQSQIPRIITDIYNDNSLFNRVEPWEFEEIIAELLRSHGYKVEMTKRTRDGGFDLIALANLDGGIPFKALVECKRYKGKVDVATVRSFKEVVMSNNANKGIIATTGYFTKDAWQKREQTPYLLDFKDKNDIVSWVEEYINKQGMKSC